MKNESIEEYYRKIAEIKIQLRRVLTPDAYQRMMNVKLANESLFLRSLPYIFNYYSRFSRKLTDSEVKKILSMLRENRDFRIVRR